MSHVLLPLPTYLGSKLLVETPMDFREGADSGGICVVSFVSMAFGSILVEPALFPLTPTCADFATAQILSFQL